MKALIAIAFCFILVNVALSGNIEKYSEVRIYATAASDFQRIADAGLFIEHAVTKPGFYSDTWLSASEIAMLRKSGVRYEVIIDDWDSYYSSLPTMNEAQRAAVIRESARLYNVSHSIYGSMGGFLTYDEVVRRLDSMRLEYPNYISQKFSIGTTIEGRTMWAVRITKGPDLPTGRPEVLYHALIHAREPESMEQQMYYFYWLFENYGTDPTATYILNNREIYWVPVFNVDGYVYNQTTNPSGGGQWRSNRHNNGSNCGWVDLNRNYGIYTYWNSSNGGSSTDACSGGSGTYRGPSPFSEPETQNMKNFVNSRNFNASFGAHTYGNYLIKPWSWSDPLVTPDDNKFNQYLADMKASNPVYTTGTPSQTVGYYVRGGSDDWYYDDSVHVRGHIIAMTPETGATGFWPTQAEIVPLAQGMLFNNQYMALIGGAYVNPLSRAFNQPTYTPGQSGSYKVVFRNKGLLSASNVTVRWSSTNSNITIPVTQYSYPLLTSFASDSATFNFTVSAGVPLNSSIPVRLTIKIDTTTIYTAGAYVMVGPGTVVLSDSGNTFNNWTRSTGGTWAVTTAQYYSPPSSFTDSPGGNYGNNADNSMILASPINASVMPVLSLSFMHKYATENGYDFVSLETSTDNGTNWQPVVSYTGTLSTWTQQTFDLTDFAAGSSQFKFRFRLTSDASQVADGWYVDDIKLNGYTLAPSTPDTGLVIRPAAFTFSGATGRVFKDSLKVKNATNASMTIALAESTVTSSVKPSQIIGPDAKDFNLSALVNKLRPAFQRAGLTRSSFQGGGAPVSSPQSYTTILTDARGETGTDGADIYRVQYQYRTGLLGSFHDFKVVMHDLPDTNVVIILSIDTDQDFGTGRFPTPLGAGPTSRDIGSEREVLIDASGLVIDSLTSFGRIRAGVVVSTDNDSLAIVGLPFLLSIQRDSVLTIGTETSLGGINVTSLNDPDGKMNIGFVASHVDRGSNLLPDYAPEIGHANIGGETGVSWLSENKKVLTLASNDSAMVGITALAARTAGTYRANIAFQPSGRAPVTLPVTMNVSTPPAAVIHVSPTTFRDTLAIGDSTVNTITIRNTGGGTLNYAVLDTSLAGWLTINPRVGSADSNISVTVSLQVSAAGLRHDTTYSASIVVVSNDPATAVVPVILSLRTRLATSVTEGGRIPATFALHQNYPNPFNPETHIAFDLPKSSSVKLQLFNLIGQEVATLVNAQLEAGTHSYTVGKERYGLSSGIYFYRLQAGEFVATKKLVLLK